MRFSHWQEIISGGAGVVRSALDWRGRLPLVVNRSYYSRGNCNGLLKRLSIIDTTPCALESYMLEKKIELEAR